VISRRGPIPGRRGLAAGLATLFASLLLAAPAPAAFDFLTKWGSNGTADGQFNSPQGVATDAAGNVYVADVVNHRIQKFSSDGNFLTKWGSFGTGDGQFNRPVGVATDPAGNVYVADSFNARIQKFTSDGTFLTKWGSLGPGEGQFDDPVGVATDAAGNVYVADDDNNHRIQKFAADGTFLRMYGWGVDTGASGFETCTSGCEAGTPGSGDGQFSSPQDVATDPAGNVYVADTFNHRIQKFDSDNVFLTKWGSFGTGAGQFSQPFGVATDPAGNVYVADSINHRIQRFSSEGTFELSFGSSGTGDGQFNLPNAVAADCRGNVYVADAGNHRIQKFGDPTDPPPPCPSSLPPEPEPQPESGPQPKADRTLIFDVNKPKVERGRKVRGSGQLEAAGNDPACEAAQTIEILREGLKRGGAQTVATLTTDAQGNFATNLKMRKTSLLSARAPETAACQAGTSDTEKVRVKKKKGA
jgi:sugar lactone lactonase YvrE